MHIWTVILSLFLASEAVANEKVVSALSQNRISITANFDGSEIFIYGALKREAPPTQGILGVVITLAGPSIPTIVRRKSRKFGIWVNTESLVVDEAPTFYAVASSAPIEKILTYVDDLKHNIRIEEMVKSVGAPMNIMDPQSFTDAIVRIRQQEGLYIKIPETVDIKEETLFGTRILLPANLVEGDYIATIYVTRDKEIVDKQESTIKLQKIGLGRWLYTVAHEQPVFYGILAVFLAAITGWFASLIFRRI